MSAAQSRANRQQQPNHVEIMAKLTEIESRLARGDKAFDRMDKRIGVVETALKPFTAVVERMGGEAEFSDQAKEVADGLRAMGTLAKWIKRLGALSVAVAALVAAVKYMIWDMWTTGGAS